MVYRNKYFLNNKKKSNYENLLNTYQISKYRPLCSMVFSHILDQCFQTMFHGRSTSFHEKKLNNDFVRSLTLTKITSLNLHFFISIMC